MVVFFEGRPAGFLCFPFLLAFRKQCKEHILQSRSGATKASSIFLNQDKRLCIIPSASRHATFNDAASSWCSKTSLSTSARASFNSSTVSFTAVSSAPEESESESWGYSLLFLHIFLCHLFRVFFCDSLSVWTLWGHWAFWV